MTGVDLYELKNDARHPLIIANDLGNRLIATCKNIMLGLVAAILGAGIIGAVTGTTGLVGAVVSMMGWFVDVPVKLLMGVAMGTEYILPNMPFIIWIGCIVGWVLLVIEAIIAAPLWAIMHLHPNGDDLTGRGGNGYTLVLSLLLRPVLMIFGMEASIVISAVIGEFINKTFFEVFAQNTGSFTGLSAVIGLAMGTLVYFIVMFIFIRKCFSLMFQLPDQLLQWIGGPTGASLGQFAGEFSQAADKGANAGAALGGFAASAAAKGISKGGGKLGNYIDNKINKDVKNREGQDKALEGQAGEGAAAVRNQFDGMKADVHPRALFKNNYAALRNAAKNSEAYDAGLVGAINTDPQHGRNDFESAFAESAANDHADYGGSPAQAATAIGQKLMERNLGSGEFGSFTIPASRNAEGQIDGKRAKSVMATIGRMQSRIGADRTKDVLDRATASGASGGDLMKHAEAFYKEELARPIEPTPPSDRIDDERKD
ncbi:DotA/TraY family protein [Ralstonia solanacearum]